ncbi:MAG: hypothetical protein WD969_05770 [Paracoccaceae bacterium]
MPPVVALICLLLTSRLTAGIRTAGTYLGAIEARYADPALLGWHATLSAIRETGAAPQPDEATRRRMKASVKLDRLSGLSAIFWRACLGVSAIIALAMMAAISCGQLELEASR